MTSRRAVDFDLRRAIRDRSFTPGRKDVAALFELLAGEPIHRAYAGITLPNEASVGLHRRFGFKEIGVYDEVGLKLGQYWSVLWLEKVMPG